MMVRYALPPPHTYSHLKSGHSVSCYIKYAMKYHFLLEGSTVSFIFSVVIWVQDYLFV